jgi:GWxTD domain-containing protein
VRVLLVFILVLTALFCSPPGRPVAQPRGHPPGEMGFSLSAHAFVDPDQRPSVLVSVDIPYSNLVFLKKGGEFRSEYTAYIKVLDGKKKIVESAVVTESVTSEDYESSRSARLRSKASRRFHLPQGDYVVECVIEVKDTQRVFKQRTTVVVPEFLETGIGVGNPRLYAVAVDTSWHAPLVVEGEYEPLPAAQEVGEKFFIAIDKHPMIAFEVYTEEEASESADCEVYFQVVDENREARAYGRSRVRIAGLKRQVSVYLGVDEWDPGSYVFVAKAVQPERARETTSSLGFVLAYTKTMLTKHFDKTLTLLSIIATPDEVAELREAAEADRARVWASFWERRDPTLGTEENEALEEHLRRVRYATENFADAAKGWESDRGKVYIKHGEPDHTELRIDPQYQGEYLIWYYYGENRRFVFYDRFGLGEYRLTDAGQL